MSVPSDQGKAQASREEKNAATLAAIEADVDKRTGELVESKRPFSDDELRNIDSLASIGALLGDKIGSATDLGSGFALLDTPGKRRLCGVPLLILMWNFSQGDMGEFVSAHVVSLDPTGKVTGKYVINDGSTGVYRQLKDWTERTGERQGLHVPRGLRASDYTFTDTDGVEKPATTFYIDTAPAA